MRFSSRFSAGVILCLLLAATAAAEPAARPAAWARPVASEHTKNLYQVDDRLYRSAQPDAAGMDELYAMGIRQVINLRQFHADDDEATGVALTLHRIPMDAGAIHDAEIIRALRVIRDADAPVLVHCWHGSDRTGTVVALYRMLFQGWSRQAAIDEMVNGGFGYHGIYSNIIRYLNQVNLSELALTLTLPPPAAVVVPDSPAPR